MSTDYGLLKVVAASDLFDGRLEKHGIREDFSNETTERSRLLTDGRNYLWVYIDDAGSVSCLRRYASSGAPGKILGAIADAFETDIASEYEPQFWGFDTQEEWDSWQEEAARKNDEKFHNELLKFLCGEPNDIRPGSIGMIEAEIAKKLVEEDPTLLLSANADKLLTEIRSIYAREHAISVKLSSQDLAAVKMTVTHEDDLPSA